MEIPEAQSNISKLERKVQLKLNKLGIKKSILVNQLYNILEQYIVTKTRWTTELILKHPEVLDSLRMIKKLNKKLKKLENEKRSYNP